MVASVMACSIDLTLSGIGEGGSGNDRVDGSGGILRILKENMMDPSAKREVSGKLEKALSYQLNSHRQTYTFSFSPGPHLLPIIRRSTTGPLSRSKLQTTISLIHLPTFLAISGVINGGGLGSPGRREYPIRSVADKGDLADVLVNS
jgi:hypothetical protein